MTNPRKNTLTSVKADHLTRRALVELGIDESELYDRSPSLDDVYAIPIADDLTPLEIAKARLFKRFYHGVFLVTGQPGQGKGLFVIYYMHLMKRLFGRRIMLDYKPRELFGPYIPFNDEIFVKELSKMSEIAETGKKDTEPSEKIKRMKKAQLSTLASHWLSSKGEIYLQGAALGLDELKNYVHNRRPHNSMGILIGHMVTIYRHLDLTLIGMTPFENEIDAFSFLPYVTHRVKCSQGTDGRIWADIYQAVWVSSSRVLRARGKPFTMRIDGNKPRSELGGLRLFDLYNTKDPKIIRTGRAISDE